MSDKNQRMVELLDTVPSVMRLAWGTTDLMMIEAEYIRSELDEHRVIVTALLIAKKRGASQALLEELENMGYYNEHHFASPYKTRNSEAVAAFWRRNEQSN